MASTDASSSGMSVLELLLAVTMMMVFTGVVAAVMEVSLRFMGEAECPVDLNGVAHCNDESTETEDVANGVVIDRLRIEALFDQMEPVLVQPGIHRSRIDSISGTLGDVPSDVCTGEGSTSVWTSNDKVPELPVLNFPVVITFVCGRLTLRKHPLNNWLIPQIKVPRLVFMFSRPCRIS